MSQVLDNSGNNDQPTKAEPVNEPIVKWNADKVFSFTASEGRVLHVRPTDFLVAESYDKLVCIHFLHHDMVVKVALRLNFEEFTAHMPDGLLHELVRGVDVCTKRLTESKPESDELEFDHLYWIKLHHHLDPKRLKKLGVG